MEGFRLRTHTGRAQRRSRPLAADRSAKQMEGHIRRLKISLRYSHGRVERDRLKGEIKEASKLLKVYAEESRAQREEIAKRWAKVRFQRNPWTAAGECLDAHTKEADQRWGKYPDCSQEEITTYFRNSMQTPQENYELPPTELLGPQVQSDMYWAEIDCSAIEAAIASKRPSAAPGADTIGNAVLKRCAALYPSIAQAFNDLLTFGTCPDSWKRGVTLLIHKDGETSILGNWRLICLTSCYYYNVWLGGTFVEF